jgi:hypothetical protein
MASGLYFGPDQRIKQILDSFFEERKREHGEVHSLIQVVEEPKFLEALNGLAFDVIFVEQGFLPQNPVDWFLRFKKTRPALQTPMILVGADHETDKIFKYILAGWRDYIFLPPDRALVIEKFWMHATGSRSSDIRQVYSLKLKEKIALAKTAEIVELSEFDVKVRSFFAVQPGELMILYSPALANEDEGEGQVLARCYKADKDAQTGMWTLAFYLIGATDKRLKSMRQTLRSQYVASKR